MPAGVLIIATSPTFLPIKPAPTGLTLLIKPWSGLASVSPTIVYSKLAFVLMLVTLTLQPTPTLLVLIFLGSIITAVLILVLCLSFLVLSQIYEGTI